MNYKTKFLNDVTYLHCQELEMYLQKSIIVVFCLIQLILFHYEVFRDIDYGSTSASLLNLLFYKNI